MGFLYNGHIGSGSGFNSGLFGVYNPLSYIANSIYFDGQNEWMRTAVGNIDTAIVTGVRPTYTMHYTFKTVINLSNQIQFSLYDNASNNAFILYSYLNNGSMRLQYYYPSGSHNLYSNLGVLVPNEWYTVTVVVDGANSKIYINGVDQTGSIDIDNVTSYGQGTYGTYWRLCAWGGAGSGNELQGYLPQFALIDDVLTSAQHIALYNNGKPRKVGDIIKNNVKTLVEDNYSWNGSAIVTTSGGWESQNMEAADITPVVPYVDSLQTIIDKYNTLNAWSFENFGINGTTSTAYDYLGVHNLPNVGASNQPTFIGGDANINNRPSGYFVTDDYLYKATADYLIGQSTGAIHCVFTTNTDVTTINRFFSSSDTATLLYRIDILILNGKLRFSMVNNTNSYTVDCTTTTILANTSYVISVYQNGTTLKILINGVAQSLTIISGTSQTYWFANIPNRDNIAIGALVASSSYYADLDIALVQITSDSSDATVLANHNEIKTIYGI